MYEILFGPFIIFLNMYVAGFRPPLQRVGCCALGLQWYTETNTLIDGNRRFIVLDQGMAPQKLATCTQKEALQK